MRAVRAGFAALALVAGLGACASDEPLDPSAGPVPAPAGWRWESFGDAELAVPQEWGHANGDVAAQLWCISDAAAAQPVVVRPGIPVESTCPGGTDGAPDPATLVATAGTFVSLELASGDPQTVLGREGDRMTIRLGAVLVRVQAADGTRSRILETLHQISVDAAGCPTTNPISVEPTRRPDEPVPVEDLGEVPTLAVCRYAIPNGRAAGELTETEELAEFTAESATAAPSRSPSPLPAASAPTRPPGSPTLLSSLSLAGDDAADAIRGIAESAVGTGPDAEDGCAEPDLRGTEAIVLRIPRGEGEAAEIYLRYGGCRSGFDDGVDERELTRAAVAPFIAGPNAVPSYGDELARILDDPDAPATSGNPEDSAEDSAELGPEAEFEAEESPFPDGAAEEEPTPEATA